MLKMRIKKYIPRHNVRGRTERAPGRVKVPRCHGGAAKAKPSRPFWHGICRACLVSLHSKAAFRGWQTHHRHVTMAMREDLNVRAVKYGKRLLGGCWKKAIKIAGGAGNFRKKKRLHKR